MDITNPSRLAKRAGFKVKYLVLAAALAGLLLGYSAGAEEILNMRTIQEMCSLKWGHIGFVDQTQCVVNVMAHSNNPDLVPSNPYIGWYTQMALKMADDVAAGCIIEGDARENLGQAWHEVLVRQQQSTSDQLDQDAYQRKLQRAVGEERRSARVAQEQAESAQGSALEQERMDRFCAAAARSVEDTCSIQTKNPKVAVGLCVTARVLYAKQGCI